MSTDAVLISDPYRIAQRPEMRFLRDATDPIEAQRVLRPFVSKATGANRLSLEAIHVTRLKPQRRCLIEYSWRADSRAFTIIGKVRLKGADLRTHQLLQSLWINGFGGDSLDNVSVPQPLGIVSHWRMCLQMKVPGTAATTLLAGQDGANLIRKIADAIHKLHQRGPIPSRRHTIADELNILRERLLLTAQSRPQLVFRLHRIWEACQSLAAKMPSFTSRPIHRDWYADQILVDGPRLYLLDFDLYCEGDPALDIGNFCGHLTEQSLRMSNDPSILENIEHSLYDRFAALEDPQARDAAEIYATLTVARLIHISTLHVERHRILESLMKWCETRFGVGRVT